MFEGTLLVEKGRNVLETQPTFVCVLVAIKDSCMIALYCMYYGMCPWEARKLIGRVLVDETHCGSTDCVSYQGKQSTSTLLFCYHHCWVGHYKYFQYYNLLGRASKVVVMSSWHGGLSG